MRYTYSADSTDTRTLVGEVLGKYIEHTVLIYTCDLGGDRVGGTTEKPNHANRGQSPKRLVAGARSLNP